MAIPPARNVELAHKFINMIYEPEWAAKNICYTGFLFAVRARLREDPSKYRNNTPAFPSDEDLSRGGDTLSRQALRSTPASGTRSRRTSEIKIRSRSTITSSVVFFLILIVLLPIS